MANWSSLSKKLQQEVVGRMDFRSRFRFRHVSKSSQTLVDTVALYLPRVVLNAKSTTEAVVSFYLAIDKWIDVICEKDRKNGSVVSVMTFSYDNVQQPVSNRHVDFEDPLMLALTIFRNVAMGKEAFCGGLEFLYSFRFFIPTHEEVDAFFGDRCYRTKVLCFNGMLSPDLTMYVDPEILEEIQFIDEDRLNTRGFTDVTVHTRRMHVRVDEAEIENWKHKIGFFVVQSYVAIQPDEIPEIINETLESLDRTNSNEFVLRKLSPCGLLIREVDIKIEHPTNIECELRWACPTHGDPFEHWYMMKKARGFPFTPADVLRTRPRVDVFPGKTKYKEIICPVINGQCPVTANLLHYCESLLQCTERKGVDEESEEYKTFTKGLLAFVNKLE